MKKITSWTTKSKLIQYSNCIIHFCKTYNTRNTKLQHPQCTRYISEKIRNSVVGAPLTFDDRSILGFRSGKGRSQVGAWSSRALNMAPVTMNTEQVCVFIFMYFIRFLCNKSICTLLVLVMYVTLLSPLMI